MTFEGLSFSEFGKSAFCVYLSGSQERAGAGPGSGFLQVQSMAAFIGYEWRSNSDTLGGGRGRELKTPFTKTSI